MSDPFADIRRLATVRQTTADNLHDEVRALRAAGYSIRAIAAAAGVAPDTIHRWSR